MIDDFRLTSDGGIVSYGPKFFYLVFWLLLLRPPRAVLKSSTINLQSFNYM